jgi:hypothetical protein
MATLPHVLPGSSGDDAIDRRRADAEALGEHGDRSLRRPVPPAAFARSVSGPDRANVVLGKYRLPAFFPARRAPVGGDAGSSRAALRTGARPVSRAARLPPFAVSVGGIVSVRPEEQVVGVHAGWVVAAMADAQAVRKGPAKQAPRDPVGERGAVPRDRDSTVPAAPSVDAPGPPPTAGVRTRTDARQEIGL